jgi:nucleotide-binding universal stress UspA family protein
MRVLIATDGSDGGQVAVALVSSIKWPACTELRIVTVVEPVEPEFATEWAQLGLHPSSYDDHADSAAASILDKASDQLARTGCGISRATLHGRAANELIRHADDFRADLIVLGTRGHGLIASMILGSVTAEVADHAPCPVLVARTETLRRLVLGVDDSGFGRVAENVVGAWPIFDDVEIEVANVAQGMPWATALVLATPVAPAQDALEASLADHRRLCMESSRRLAQRGRRSSSYVVLGNPAHELMRRAADSKADLIVVGTHGRTGLARALMGSVARNVMTHATCSVLIVRQVDRSVIGVAA